MRCCPTCGGKVDDVEVNQLPDWAFETGGFGPSELIVLALLVKQYPARARREGLHQKLYAHRSDGGPVSAANTLSVHIHRLRKKLKQFGWTVSRHTQDSGWGYRLQKIGEEEMTTIQDQHKKRWTTAETKLLHDMVYEARDGEDITLQDMAQKIGRTQASVYKKLTTTGLRRWMDFGEPDRRKNNRSDDPKVVDGFRLIKYAGADK